MDFLASDIDGTLAPSKPDRAWFAARGRFRAFVRARRDLRLAYVTGRDLALALRGIREYGLPCPHALVCDVGSSIYLRDGRAYRPDAGYQAILRRQLGSRSMADVRRILDGVTGLVLQEEDRQSDFKLSFYLPADADPRRVVARLRARLARAGVRAGFIHSVDPEGQTGLLDVLPRGAAKDSAVLRLAARFGVPPERVVYAGDSGNDLKAFTSGVRAVVVANTPDDIKAAVRAHARKMGWLSRIFFATRPCLHGVLEGCEHFGM